MSSETPLVQCIRHSHSALGGESWCGRDYGTEITFGTVDEAIYSIGTGGNLRPCSDCIQSIIEWVKPEAEFFADDGMREAPPRDWLDAPHMSSESQEMIINLYKLILPGASAIISNSAISSAALFNSFEALPSRFPLLSIDGSHQEIGEVRLHWSGGMTAHLLEFSEDIFEQIEKQSRTEFAEFYAEGGDARLLTWILIALIISETIRRVQWVLSGALDSAYAEACLSAQLHLARLRGAPLPLKEKEKQIKQMVRDYEKNLRQRLSRGRQGRQARPLRMEYRELVHVVREWNGQAPPTIAEFAAKVPSLRSAAVLTGKDKREHDQKARERLRTLIRACKKAGLCPDTEWPELFHKIRSEEAMQGGI